MKAECTLNEDFVYLHIVGLNGSFWNKYILSFHYIWIQTTMFLTWEDPIDGVPNEVSIPVRSSESALSFVFHAWRLSAQGLERYFGLYCVAQLWNSAWPGTDFRLCLCDRLELYLVLNRELIKDKLSKVGFIFCLRDFLYI